MRLLSDGELVWVHGPRRQELATVRIDDTLPRGDVVAARHRGRVAVGDRRAREGRAYDTPRNPGLV